MWYDAGKSTTIHRLLRRIARLFHHLYCCEYYCELTTVPSSQRVVFSSKMLIRNKTVKYQT